MHFKASMPIAFHDPLDRRTFFRSAAVGLATARLDLLRSCQESRLMDRLVSADELSALGSATAWINSPPITSERLAGRVVLVQFWTFTCINWLRTLPYTRAWAETYRNAGLVTIGVHTPEFAFERDVLNVRRSSQRLQVDYPVAVDSDSAIWRAFSNQYWPALYLLDGKGRVRHHMFGEGGYAESEQVIRELLTQVGVATLPRERAPVEGRGVEAPADWADARSPENYLGSERTEGFASPTGINPGVRRTYTSPSALDLNQWALDGEWTVGRQAIASSQNGRITYRFHSRDLHLVMGPPSGAGPVRFRVLLDGQPPGASHGLDVDAQGNGVATEQRLYQLIRQPHPIADRTFQIEFVDPGVEAFAFTFG
jgi:thiol-disulfide isomerase/thioredoxin